MNNKSELRVSPSSLIANATSCLFGVLFFAIGIVNTFWGNDPQFGICLIGLSFIYYPPVTIWIKEITGFAIPGYVKIILAILVLIGALGVGELFAKIDMMRADLNF